MSSNIALLCYTVDCSTAHDCIVTVKLGYVTHHFRAELCHTRWNNFWLITDCYVHGDECALKNTEGFYTLLSLENFATLTALMNKHIPHPMLTEKDLEQMDDKPDYPDMLFSCIDNALKQLRYDYDRLSFYYYKQADDGGLNLPRHDKMMLLSKKYADMRDEVDSRIKQLRNH